MHHILHILTHSLTDTAQLLPFLLLSSLLSEYLEHRAANRTLASLHHLGAKGPIFGALAGLMPMCGLSAAAAQLFAAGRISPGTLLAAFAAESDEAIPLLLATPGQLPKALYLTLTNLGTGILAGLLADRIFRYTPDKEACGCIHHHTHDTHCADRGLLAAALRRTAEIGLYVFLAVLAMTALVESIGEENIAAFLQKSALLQPLCAALIGLIPNCAPSVLLSQFHLGGMLSYGALTAGLTVNAGMGLTVLWQQNKNKGQNLRICLFLVAAALLLGYTMQLLGL